MEKNSVWPKAKSPHAALRRISRTTREITGLVFDPALSRTYWPEEPRKGKSRVLLDLIWWLLRTGEANRFYYVYGMDRKTTRRDDVMAFRRFQQLRNRANLRIGQVPHNYNYVCVLRDKFLFAQFVQGLGVPTPKTLALLDSDTVTWLDTNETRPLESLCESGGRSLDGFCKKFAGMQGHGAFALKIERGELSIAGEKVSLEQVRERLTGAFLFQRRIVQHPAMQQLHGDSVNTLRLVSFYENRKATVSYGALRVGAGRGTVDNWAAGGLIVGIDLARGVLRSEGFFKPGHGGRTRVHPDSGVTFEGFQLPFFAEAMAMVARLHERLPHIHSIGWDVALSPEGPVVIEGNDDWDGAIQMVLDCGFKDRFLASLDTALAKRPAGRPRRRQTAAARS